MLKFIRKLLDEDALGQRAFEDGCRAAEQLQRRVHAAASAPWAEIDQQFGVNGHSKPTFRHYPELKRRKLKRPPTGN
jgi:hypothetical protein